LAAKRTARATPFSIDSPGLLAPPVTKFDSYVNSAKVHDQTLFICSSFELLADESRDLSHAEKKVTAVKAEQILIYFHSKQTKVVLLCENSYHIMNLLNLL
jgi:hypothetical protein